MAELNQQRCRGAEFDINITVITEPHITTSRMEEIPALLVRGIVGGLIGGLFALFYLWYLDR
jgi:hypothetical protein